MLTAYGAHDAEPGLPERLRALLVSARGGAWVTREGRIVFWNRAAQAALGFGPEILGRGCADVLICGPERSEPVCRHERERALDHTFVTPARRRDGSRVWLQVTACTVEPGQGKDPLVVHAFQDVTPNRELIGELRERFPARPDETSMLTPRELEVLRLMAQGVGTHGAADHLGVSRATLRNHVQNIFAKLGVHSRVEAIVHATRRRLV